MFEAHSLFVCFVLRAFVPIVSMKHLLRIVAAAAMGAKAEHRSANGDDTVDIEGAGNALCPGLAARVAISFRPGGPVIK